MNIEFIHSKMIIFTGIVLFAGCRTTEKIPEKNERPVTFSMYLGGSRGGFIEETDIDAISGATNTVKGDSSTTSIKFCAGVHTEYRFNNKHKIEAGLDFIPHQQSIFYNDPQLNYIGRLDINYYRFSIPLTYNLSVLKNRNKNTMLYLKTGLTFNYIRTSSTIITGKIPDFSISRINIAPLFGIIFIPVRFRDYSLGVFFNTSLLKGSKVFTDEIYHKSKKAGLMSTLEMGIYINLNK